MGPGSSATKRRRARPEATVASSAVESTDIGWYRSGLTGGQASPGREGGTKDFSKLGAADKRILIAAIAVLVGGIISIIDRWGVGGIGGGLAGLGAAFVVLQPQLAPTLKLPMPKSTTLVILGGVAAGGFVISALQYIEYVFILTRVYTLLFDLGLVAALALAYFTWLEYKAALGPAAPPPAAPTPPAEPPAAPPAA